MRGAKPDLKAIDGGLLNAPPPPETLAKSMHPEWIEICADLIGRGLLATSALGLVETYVGALWLARECRKALAQDGPVVRTKDGNPKPHPCAAMLRNANDSIARLGGELGLSPASRNRRGMKPDPDDDTDSDLGF